MSAVEQPTYPYCECGHCDSTGRGGGPEIQLPFDAWAIAGDGDLSRLAVLPAHALHYAGDYVLVEHEGWVEVGR